MISRSQAPIQWSTATAGATPDGAAYLVKAEHWLDERQLAAFSARVQFWASHKPEYRLRVEATPSRRRPREANGSLSVVPGVLKIYSERLAGLDPTAFAFELQQLASEAARHVDEQREFDEEHLGPWVTRLREQP